MNTIKMILMTGLLAPSIAWAGSVYTCKGPEGETKFSFTPCEPTTRHIAKPVKPAPAQTPRIEKLANLDQEIQVLQRTLKDIQAAYRSEISSDDGRQRADELTQRFDTDTMQLISELNSLQTERENIARL